MFRGLLWYLIIGAIALLSLFIAKGGWAGTDTATFEWNVSSESEHVDGYAIIWDYPHKHHSTRVEYKGLEAVDGRYKVTVTDLPNETIFFQIVAYQELPGGNCTPTRNDSLPSYKVTRYIGPYITPKIPQDGVMEKVSK